MTASEIMTIIVSFCISHHRGFKHYYLTYVFHVYKEDLPHLLSFTLFIEAMPRVIVSMSAYVCLLDSIVQKTH
jgi:hypothetical protein